MSRETTVTFKSDLDGSAGTDKNPVTGYVFAWQGQHYEIDLTATQANELENALTKFILKARQITRLRATAVAGNGGDGATIRAWAKSQVDDQGAPRWPDLADRGKLSDEILTAYAGRDNKS